MGSFGRCTVKFPLMQACRNLPWLSVMNNSADLKLCLNNKKAGECILFLWVGANMPRASPLLLLSPPYSVCLDSTLFFSVWAEILQKYLLYVKC